MLYEKSKKEKKLSDELFKNPTSEYRGAPFWAWNCELKKEELLWQIEELKKMGFGGFHMHVRAGMATEYLSDEYMDLISSCVKKAKDEDMKAYLYDEDMWPSGFAGGKVTKNKKLRQKYLTITLDKMPSVDEKTAYETGETVFLSAYDIIFNDKGELISYKKINEDDPHKGVKRYAYIITREDAPRFNNQAYVDTFSKEAIDEFIAVTHERFKSVVGSDFGQTVPSIFTDEPQYFIKNNVTFALTDDDIYLPWTWEFDNEFKGQKGYSIVDKLPEVIWLNNGGKATRVMYDYYDFTSWLFNENFSKNVGEWCSKNGLHLTGHVMQEDNLWSQTVAVGDAMRAYQYFGIPGVDLLCDRREFNTLKQCQSVVRQRGKDGMLSELYGVTDWTFDFRGHKNQGDWQAALGVTLRVPHLSWVSMKGSAKRDYPASINYQSPWYKEYSYIENHFARVNSALTRGKAKVKVAVVHPIETYWRYMGPEEACGAKREEMRIRFVNLTNWLLEGTIDFDFISESDILTQDLKATDKLTVGQMSYDTVILPANETIRENTFNILNEFASNGGKVIALEKAPYEINCEKSDKLIDFTKKVKVIPFSETAILSALEEDRILSILNEDSKRTTNLIYNYREDSENDWLFIAHKDVKAGIPDRHSCLDVTKKQDIIINIKGEFTPVLYDTLTGEIVNIPYEYKDGNTVIKRTIYDNDSLLFRLDKVKTPCDKVIKEIVYGEYEHLHGLAEVEREEDNVVLLDEGEYKFDDGKFLPFDEIKRIEERARELFNYPQNSCQPYVLKAGEPQHSITMKYSFNAEKPFSGLFINVEDADKVEIYLNKKKIKGDVIGYFIDKAVSKIALPKVKKGKNIIEIKLPFGERSFLEPSYITGDFSVSLLGTEKTIVKPIKKIGFGDIVNQGMPFYGGNLTYKFNYTAKESGKYEFTVNVYRGALTKIKVDGKDLGTIAFMPYAVITELEKGDHLIELKLFGNRKNTVGSLHNGNFACDWIGPWHYLPRDEEFRYEYILSQTGILSAPSVRMVLGEKEKVKEKSKVRDEDG